MLGLNKKGLRIFRTALVCHLLFALGLFLYGFIPSCEEEPEVVHVFELASSAPPLSRPAPPKPTPKPVIQKPKPTPPKPKPVPKPVVQKPTPKPAPKPVVKEVAKPSPPKKISFDQFRKQHNVPAPKPVKRQPAPQPVKIKINPNDFKLAPIVVNTPTTTSTISPSLVNQYLAGVKSRLEEVWQLLLAQTDLGTGGVAHLSFRIGSDGSLQSVSVTRSSGNRSLENLVLRVARTVGNVGRPPGGSFSSSLEIPFRVN